VLMWNRITRQDATLTDSILRQGLVPRDAISSVGAWCRVWIVLTIMSRMGGMIWGVGGRSDPRSVRAVFGALLASEIYEYGWS
jgi:hypothetical protein